ncbi:MAG: tetratricopeptide repeat protein [bacterium]
MTGRSWKKWLLWMWFFLAYGMSWNCWGTGVVHLQLLRFQSKIEAERVYSEIKAGKEFDLFADQWAPEGFKQAKGYMGTVVPERLSHPIKKALIALKPGESSPPVGDQGNWFIFKVLDPAQAYRYDPGEESSSHYLERGFLLGELGDTQGELEAYRKAVSLDPELAAAHVNLGEALRRQALLVLEQARGNPTEAQAMEATELLDEAIDEFKAAIALDKELWEAHFNLGLAYAAQGLLDLTLLEFQEAVRIQPQSGELHRALALALLMRERLAEALWHAERARELGAEVGDLIRRIREQKPPKDSRLKK